jgi:hypothetical protein
MAAASVSRGAVLEKRALNQLNLLADSVQRTVGSQLTGDMSGFEDDPSVFPLVDLIYEEITKDIVKKVNASPNEYWDNRLVEADLPLDVTLDFPVTTQIPEEFEPETDTQIKLESFTVSYIATFERYRGQIWSRSIVWVPQYDDEGNFLNDMPWYKDTIEIPEVKRQIISIKECNVMIEYDFLYGTISMESTATYSIPEIVYASDLPLSNKSDVDAIITPPLTGAEAPGYTHDGSGSGNQTQYIERVYGNTPAFSAIPPVKTRNFDDLDIISFGTFVDDDENPGDVVLVPQSDHGKAVSYEKVPSDT